MSDDAPAHAAYSELTAAEREAQDIEMAIRMSLANPAAEATGLQATGQRPVALETAVPSPSPSPGPARASSFSLQTVDSGLQSVDSGLQSVDSEGAQQPHAPMPSRQSFTGQTRRMAPSHWDHFRDEFRSIDSEKKVGAAATIGCLLFTAVIALFAASFKYVEYNEMALKKNIITNSIDLDNHYLMGRYLWTVFHAPVPFPSTYQFVEFDDVNELIVFDRRGLTIKLYSSFQYKLVPEDLGKLYKRWGHTYHDQVINIARAHLKNSVSSLFEANDYFQNRSFVQEKLRTILTTKLRSELFVEVPKGKFQLRQVELPPVNVQSLQRVVVAKQQNLVKQLEIQAKLIEMDTRIQIEEVYNAPRYVYESTTRALTIALNQNSTARAERIRARAVAKGHIELTSKLGVDFNSEAYIKMCRLMQVQAGTILITGLAASNIDLVYGAKPDGSARRRSANDTASILSPERLAAALSLGAVDRA